jgi:ABC-type polysaccharide/polyol phosphate transport system ATPase subunit
MKMIRFLMGKKMAKSTLLKIIAGQSKPSTGNISAPKDGSLFASAFIGY